MKAVGIHHGGRNAVGHQALLIDAGNGTAGTHGGTLGGGVTLAVGVLQTGGHAILGTLFRTPLDGAVEEEAVGHLHALGGGIFLGPGHLIQGAVVAQGKFRLADGRGIDIRVAPAVVIVAVGVALVALQPVFGGSDLMQRIAGLASGPVGDVLIVFLHKAVIGVHGHLLIDRSLGDGGLHHRLVVP